MDYPIKKKRKISNRSIIALAILVLIIIVAGIFEYSHKNNAKQAISYKQPSIGLPQNNQLTAAESGLLPWQLNSPLSRMAVYSGANNQLVIAGGLTASNLSASGIYTLNTSSGTLTQTGDLPYSLHDAASAPVGNNFGIFGGGDSNSYARTSLFNSNGQVTETAALPQARSDAAAINLNGKTYIIGGYNGSNADPEVLVTSDGKSYRSIGSLPVPVRYAAVTSSGKYIFVFGGEAIGGSNSGQPVSDVQIINTANNSISLTSWHLPVPLEGAAAFNINGEIFLAGGQSNTPETIHIGVGTTQVPGVNVASNSLTYNTIWALDSSTGKFLNAGTLQLPVSNAGTAVIGSRAWIVGGEYNGQVVATVQMVTPNTKFGIAGQPGAGSPYFGAKLLIADRGNNRLLVLDSSMNITWRYPSVTTNAQSSKAFYFPDDAFFANKGTEIISNQENNNTIVTIGYPSGKVLWTYGHALTAGTANGYLRAPDDAYLLKNNNVVVADDQNCRVQFINPAGQVVGQIGKTGVCVHNPNVSLGSPNGDTPLFDGNILISEILGSWVSEYTPQGKMVWTVHLPISYPSDPQQIGASPGNNPDHYLIADYANPGSIIQFTREGQILSKYRVTSGPGMLKYPSLVELLPSGVYMANDDHRDRMVAIDPATGALVWQYGVSDTPGTSNGMLHKPDGFDILLPNGTTPTHLATK